jgi:putative oxidoreductase
LAVVNTISAGPVASRFKAVDLVAARRLLVAAVFLLSGGAKITNSAPVIYYIQSVGLRAFSMVIEIAAELIGGVRLLVGYRSKTTAAVLATFTLVTAAFFHPGLGDANQSNHLLEKVVVAGGLLHLAGFGAGRFSVDGVHWTSMDAQPR